MIFRNLDINHDWTFGKGINNYTRLNQAIGLNIKTRILSWLGDCFFAQQEGIDWVNRLGSKNQRGLLEADLRRIILQTQDVTGINSFDIVYNQTGRGFSASYSVNTIYSQEYIDSVEVGI
jgi:hypothetical protein